MPGWAEILEEITTVPPALHPVDQVRKKYLKLLHDKTKRNIIAYYSGWIQRGDNRLSIINDNDKNAFMSAIKGMDTRKGLDLILHTPGGDTAATESIVFYLRSKFGTDIRAIVPQISMSAGTMIACACKEIIMGKQSNIGPIDPQLGGMPCFGVIKEFNNAIEECKKDPSKALLWSVIIKKYHPSFIGQCQNAIEMAKEMVEKWLETGMFAGDLKAKEKISNIVSFLNSDDNKSHSRHIHFDDCIRIGLKVSLMEQDHELQDRILSVHHAFMHSLGYNPSTYKIIENHNGQAMFINSAPLQNAQ